MKKRYLEKMLDITSLVWYTFIRRKEKEVQDKMFIAEKLRKCREEKALTQTEMMFEIDKIGLRISRPTLINWETGATTPDANEVATLAMFFEKPVQYFFDNKQHLNGKAS
jgi:DNA-binding XRE family transcriptional regulator